MTVFYKHYGGKRRKFTIATCTLCGKNFEAPYYKKRKYCSQSCSSQVHGECLVDGKRPRLYSIYLGMRDRCNNPRSTGYKHYGGKGIKCHWNSYMAFKKDMQDGYSDDLSIDRIDVNGDYCKENCRWATNKQQSNNTTRNRLLTYNGKTQNMQQWADELGMKQNTILCRIDRYGWSIEEALSIKVKRPNLKNRKN